uniref:Reverse transcriptase domain-containing protein n=1 Tax=Steinernema glaseri TaxID=37863 RepID=A0A1I7ZHQ8_9BILA
MTLPLGEVAEMVGPKKHYAAEVDKKATEFRDRRHDTGEVVDKTVKKAEVMDTLELYVAEVEPQAGLPEMKWTEPNVKGIKAAIDVPEKLSD